MSEAPVVQHAALAEQRTVSSLTLLPRRAWTFCLVEIQKLRHDRLELVTRAIQPVLWLVIFGETFTHIRMIPTGNVPYLDYLAPGIIAQSGMFVAIFYGVLMVWDRDAGILAKLLVTPTPRAALVAGKSFAATVRALVQVVIVLITAALLGVALTWNPIRLLGAASIVALGTIFFACLSMMIAGLVKNRDRVMGIGQAITMPLFFASNALYPVALMPKWLQVISKVNPLSYEVSALRGLLIGLPTNLWLDYAVLIVAATIMVLWSSRLLDRMAQ